MDAEGPEGCELRPCAEPPPLPDETEPDWEPAEGGPPPDAALPDGAGGGAGPAPADEAPGTALLDEPAFGGAPALGGGPA